MKWSVPCLTLASLLWSAAAIAQKTVTVVDKGNKTQELHAVNPRFAPITVVIRFESRENTAVDQLTPVVAVVPAQQHTPVRVATVSAEDPSKPWRYRYRASWRMGSYRAHHDGTHVYELPYPPGQRVPVSQGFEGGFSHHGRYAVDWRMPEGTSVHAARAGVVVEAVAHHRRGGTDPELRNKANRVRVLHDDGSIGSYLHLRVDGVRVREGQTVAAGELIGLSGNTGFSSGPHLHFDVSVPLRRSSRNTFPVRFNTSESGVVELAKGKSYSRHPESAQEATGHVVASPSIDGTGADEPGGRAGPWWILVLGVLIIGGLAVWALRPPSAKRTGKRTR